jgi:LuxR family maltose regulon positive regulatory protein
LDIDRSQAFVAGHPRIARTPVIDRPRLLRRLAASPHASIAVVVAPSGYGKTTLLRQWDADDNREFIWVSLDHRHDDPTMLVGTIAAALDSSEPLDRRVFAPLMAPRPNLWNVVVPRLCEAVARRRSPFVLVLDDLHQVSDRTALEPLAAIAESVPEGSRLAIASREDSGVPLGRLRTQRGVIELGTVDLAMTPAETGALLRRLGHELSEDDVERLLERTEGWPAGTYLAALTIDSDSDATAAIGRFYGDDRVVAEYLREEFLQGLSAEQRVFLVRASVLDRLSGPICDQVLERTGSQALLKRLSHSNLLLAPLDRREREYRCHPLLREMLASERPALGPGEESALHRRACAWYSAGGDVDRAVPHAIAGGDRELAAELIWASTPRYESSGRHATLRAWLDEFSEDEITASPPLCLTLATSRLTLGDGTGCEHWTRVAVEALKGYDGPDAVGLMLAARVIRSAGAARDGVVSMREDVAEAANLLPEDAPWRALCCLLEGVSWHLTADPERAKRWLDEGARRGAEAAPNVGVLCLAQLALVAIDENDLPHAGDLTRRATELTAHFALQEHPTSALTLAVRALVTAREGRSDDAKHDLGLASGLLAELRDLSAWYEAEVRIVIARALLLLDDVGSARARLAEAGRFLQRCPDAAVLRDWIQTGWKEADTANAVTGRWPLSPAELRLLHHLPTHLTFREIADELFVSANTVKTQARSIYRKLGVSSRAEAVQCARTAGLLGA